MRDIPVSELVTEWTHVTGELRAGAGAEAGAGHERDDGLGCEREVGTEDVKGWTVSMSVGSRRYADGGGVEAHDAVAPGEVPFVLRVEGRGGEVLWDMAWTWGGA